jgi:mRNA-degrading endonuclease RelE of RelBE toxin-antitoxin system
MKIFVTNTFKRAAKKLHKNQIEILDDAISKIQMNPKIGEQKLGDLSDVRVYKFHMLHQQILLAYSFDEEKKHLILFSFAPHENFYENLKTQLKN